jgi:hypothetical protein
MNSGSLDALGALCSLSSAAPIGNARIDVRGHYFSRGVHNAGRLTFEVAVRYPYHPLNGQSVLVVGETEHGGALHLIVRKPGGAKLLLPAWMTFPESSSVTILSCPRLSVNGLLELRALLDRLMASSSTPRARRRTKQ